MDDLFDYKAWVKRRKQTTRVFYLESASLGMEYALTFVTLYLYLENVLMVEHVVLFYSAISVTYMLSQSITSLISSRLFDRYRKLKTMFLIGNVLIILGNILYTIPWSPWLLLTGRLISGGGGSLRAIMISELIRSYPEDQLMPKLSAMGMSYAIGFIAGPAINFFFVKADFWFLGVHINYANASGLVLTMLFIIVTVLAIFYVSDLSDEYDFKQETQMQEWNLVPSSITDTNKNEEELTENSTNTQIGRISSWLLFLKLFCNINTGSILLLSLFLMHCFTCFDIWQPMACIYLMKWSILEMNIITFGQGLSALVMLLIITYKPPSNDAIVYLAMSAVVGLGCVLGIYVAISVYSSNKSLNIILWCVYCFCFAMTVINEEVFLVGTMAQMVPSSIQAFAESVRYSFSMTGAVVALIAAGPAFQFVTYVCIGYFVVTCFALVLLIWRKRHYQYPTIQEF